MLGIDFIDFFPIVFLLMFLRVGRYLVELLRPLRIIPLKIGNWTEMVPTVETFFEIVLIYDLRLKKSKFPRVLQIT